MKLASLRVFAACIMVLAMAPATPARAATVPGVPRFFNYVSPPGTGDDAGEPTFGVNETTEQTFSNSNGPIPNGGTVNYFGGFLPYMLKVTFNDCQSPAGVTWDQKTLLTANAPRVYGDPILYTDRTEGRTLVSQLLGLTPAGSTTDYTDDDGDTFQPTMGSNLPSCVDHQTLGGGPFHAPLVPTLYQNAVYYCSQCVSHATCALSLDGGITFLPGSPMFTVSDCAGLHGHIKVAPDGTAFVPDKGCGGLVPLLFGGEVAVVVSEDNGATWDIRTIPGQTSNHDGDPSVGVANDSNTIYMAWNGLDNHPMTAVSHDKGLTWTNIRDVGTSLGIQACVFPAIVAGDPDRAAFAFYGTTTGGAYDTEGFPGIWHLYVSVTYDGGNTWTTQNVTPGDPIQRGGICGSGTCRNMLDFMDAEMDKEGRILVCWDDGCIGGCVNAPPNSFTAKAAITRQSGGKRLLAAFDPVEPRIAEAPGVTALETAGIIHLSWQAPDNGGADLTSYKVYHSIGSGGPFTLLGTTAGTSFDHMVNPMDDNVYHVTAVNSQGEGPYCGDVRATEPPPSPCDVPGIVAVNDVNSDGTDNDAGQNVPPDPTVNVRHLAVAEPYLGPGVNQIWFTLQLPLNSGALTPSSQWYIIWNRGSIAPDGSDRRFVAMKTDVAGALSFVYGDFGPPLPLDGSIPPVNANTPTPLGPADFGSYDPVTGTVLIKLATANAKSPAALPGSDLAGLNVRTYIARPDGGQRSQNNANDITGDGSYTIYGNANCFVNQPPVAALSATPTAGIAPLTVSFDASDSFDPDLGDGVAEYHFSFGDGSPDVIQSSPTLQYTYFVGSGSSGFFARVTVKDTYSQQSLNAGTVNIKVTDEPTPSEVALANVEATSGSVKLTWYAGDLRPASITVFRRGGDEEYVMLGRVSPNDEGTIEFVDTEVTAGTRYSYRLLVVEEEETWYSTEIWVAVPQARFRLAALTNPARGRMNLALDLDRDGQVQVQVFNPAGRLVADVVDDYMAAGTHELTWEGRDQTGQAAAAGFYIVRASAGGQVAKTRVVLVP